ncbi:ATP-binding protein [Metabacillus sp. GX 13764]|uniref:ATP-binding protein n=1 Tax=Metabacillus kandeliae TaxID=2900151 RepID=UPI001E4836A6|nr:ATP-binding protein [Metabacillus kandeliae]MCD7035177.1 ATP-binding protein [Metabacillus kandeliae]
MEMQLVVNRYEKVPFPYFLVDRKLNILSVSRKTFAEFDEAVSFLDIVGIGSKKKAAKFILDTPSISKVELNLKTKNKALCLFDIYVQYETKDLIHIFCVNKEEALEPVYQAMKNLELDLLDANLSLLEKNAELEDALQKLRELTAVPQNLTSFKSIASNFSKDSARQGSLKGFFKQVKPNLVGVESGAFRYLELDKANHILFDFLFDNHPLSLNKEKIQLSQLLDEVVLHSKNEAVHYGCAFSYKANFQNPLIQIDVKRISQVLMNLLKNAFEACEGNTDCTKQINLYTRLTKNAVEIHLEDSGHGMESSILSKLYTPFFTTRKTNKGLGLAVSREIMKLHEGEIEIVESTEDGTKAKIMLPLSS